MTYQRIERHNRVYYVHDSVFEAFNQTDKQPHMCMAMSDFVIDPGVNQLIKCRYPIEWVLDEWLGLVNNTPVPQPMDGDRPSNPVVAGSNPAWGANEE